MSLFDLAERFAALPIAEQEAILLAFLEWVDGRSAVSPSDIQY
jgi:hypothetical protein